MTAVFEESAEDISAGTRIMCQSILLVLILALTTFFGNPTIQQRYDAALADGVVFAG